MIENDSQDDEYTGRYHGFSLSSIGWGYREIFSEAIEELFDQGYLGEGRGQVTSQFFELLKQADRSCFDHVLRRFLGALTPENRWIMDLPGVFADLLDLGGSLATARISYGIKFFQVLADRGMGESPEELRNCLSWIRRLRETDPELSVAFLVGYQCLVQRMTSAEIEQYIDVALRIYGSNHGSGSAFLRGELFTSESYILAITQECRLCDVSESLCRTIKGLAGTEVQIANLGALDSDDLQERGTTTVTLSKHLYLPERTRRFATARFNRLWYMLCAIASSAMILENSFPRIHGHREFHTCADLVGFERARVNLFVIIEYTRVLCAAQQHWPGARTLIGWGLAEICSDQGRPGSPERLLVDSMDLAFSGPIARRIREAADLSVNCIDTISQLDVSLIEDASARYREITTSLLRPIGFLSDFMFPIHFSAVAPDQVVVDLKREATRAQQRRQAGRNSKTVLPTSSDEDSGEAERRDDLPNAVYIYDEWDIHQNEYRHEWCQVFPRTPEPAPANVLLSVCTEETALVRSVFERLRPDLARREKRLTDGDDVNTDQLLTHLIDRRLEPSPSVRFYERPVINQRDLAVLILLDASGSTGQKVDQRRTVLEIEIRAAALLAHGLTSLGDRFAVTGFSSSGREQCDYLLLKDFDAPWDQEAEQRLTAVRPQTSTRIGAALRHSGFLMSREQSRQRLILLITDGKPTDQEYDPVSRYAQHDVRMACEENSRIGISTFAISTEENSVADMEIMFPRRRFVILPSIEQLPRVLPQLYLRLTV